MCCPPVRLSEFSVSIPIQQSVGQTNEFLRPTSSYPQHNKGPDAEYFDRPKITHLIENKQFVDCISFIHFSFMRLTNGCLESIQFGRVSSFHSPIQQSESEQTNEFFRLTSIYPQHSKGPDAEYFDRPKITHLVENKQVVGCISFIHFIFKRFMVVSNRYSSGANPASANHRLFFISFLALGSCGKQPHRRGKFAGGSLAGLTLPSLGDGRLRYNRTPHPCLAYYSSVPGVVCQTNSSVPYDGPRAAVPALGSDGPKNTNL